MINPDKVESRLSSKIFRTLTLYMLIVLCTFFGYVMLFKDVRDTSKPGSGTAVTSPFTALINSLMATETMETDLNFSVAGADLQLQMAGDIKLDIQNQDFSANLDLVYNDSFYTISAYKNSNLQESNTIFVSVNDESYKMDLGASDLDLMEIISKIDFSNLNIDFDLAPIIDALERYTGLDFSDPNLLNNLLAIINDVEPIETETGYLFDIAFNSIRILLGCDSEYNNLSVNVELPTFGEYTVDFSINNAVINDAEFEISDTPNGDEHDLTSILEIINNAKLDKNTYALSGDLALIYDDMNLTGNILAMLVETEETMVPYVRFSIEVEGVNSYIYLLDQTIYINLANLNFKFDLSETNINEILDFVETDLGVSIDSGMLETMVYVLPALENISINWLENGLNVAISDELTVENVKFYDIVLDVFIKQDEEENILPDSLKLSTKVDFGEGEKLVTVDISNIEIGKNVSEEDLNDILFNDGMVESVETSTGYVQVSNFIDAVKFIDLAKVLIETENLTGVINAKILTQDLSIAISGEVKFDIKTMSMSAQISLESEGVVLDFGIYVEDILNLKEIYLTIKGKTLKIDLENESLKKILSQIETPEMSIVLDTILTELQLDLDLENLDVKEIVLAMLHEMTVFETEEVLTLNVAYQGYSVKVEVPKANYNNYNISISPITLEDISITKLELNNVTVNAEEFEIAKPTEYVDITSLVEILDNAKLEETLDKTTYAISGDIALSYDDMNLTGNILAMLVETEEGIVPYVRFNTEIEGVKGYIYLLDQTIYLNLANLNFKFDLTEENLNEVMAFIESFTESSNNQTNTGLDNELETPSEDTVTIIKTILQVLEKIHFAWISENGLDGIQLDYSDNVEMSLSLYLNEIIAKLFVARNDNGDILPTKLELNMTLNEEEREHNVMLAISDIVLGKNVKYLEDIDFNENGVENIKTANGMTSLIAFVDAMNLLDIAEVVLNAKGVTGNIDTTISVDDIELSISGDFKFVFDSLTLSMQISIDFDGKDYDIGIYLENIAEIKDIYITIAGKTLKVDLENEKLKEILEMLKSNATTADTAEMLETVLTKLNIDIDTDNFDLYETLKEILTDLTLTETNEKLVLIINYQGYSAEINVYKNAFDVYDVAISPIKIDNITISKLNLFNLTVLTESLVIEKPTEVVDVTSLIEILDNAKLEETEDKTTYAVSGDITLSYDDMNLTGNILAMLVEAEEGIVPYIRFNTEIEGVKGYVYLLDKTIYVNLANLNFKFDLTDENLNEVMAFVERFTAEDSVSQNVNDETTENENIEIKEILQTVLPILKNVYFAWLDNGFEITVNDTFNVENISINEILVQILTKRDVNDNILPDSLKLSTKIDFGEGEKLVTVDISNIEIGKNVSEEDLNDIVFNDGKVESVETSTGYVQVANFIDAVKLIDLAKVLIETENITGVVDANILTQDLSIAISGEVKFNIKTMSMSAQISLESEGVVLDFGVYVEDILNLKEIYLTIKGKTLKIDLENESLKEILSQIETPEVNVVLDTILRELQLDLDLENLDVKVIVLAMLQGMTVSETEEVLTLNVGYQGYSVKVEVPKENYNNYNISISTITLDNISITKLELNNVTVNAEGFEIAKPTEYVDITSLIEILDNAKLEETEDKTTYAVSGDIALSYDDMNLTGNILAMLVETEEGIVPYIRFNTEIEGVKGYVYLLDQTIYVNLANLNFKFDLTEENINEVMAFVERFTIEDSVSQNVNDETTENENIEVKEILETVLPILKNVYFAWIENGFEITVNDTFNVENVSINTILVQILTKRDVNDNILPDSLKLSTKIDFGEGEKLVTVNLTNIEIGKNVSEEDLNDILFNDGKVESVETSAGYVQVSNFIDAVKFIDLAKVLIETENLTGVIDAKILTQDLSIAVSGEVKFDIKTMSMSAQISVESEGVVLDFGVYVEDILNLKDIYLTIKDKTLKINLENESLKEILSQIEMPEMSIVLDTILTELQLDLDLENLDVKEIVLAMLHEMTVFETEEVLTLNVAYQGYSVKVEVPKANYNNYNISISPITLEDISITKLELNNVTVNAEEFEIAKPTEYVDITSLVEILDNAKLEETEDKTTYAISGDIALSYDDMNLTGNILAMLVETEEGIVPYIRFNTEIEGVKGYVYLLDKTIYVNLANLNFKFDLTEENINEVMAFVERFTSEDSVSQNVNNETTENDIDVKEILQTVLPILKNVYFAWIENGFEITVDETFNVENISINTILVQILTKRDVNDNILPDCLKLSTKIDFGEGEKLVTVDISNIEIGRNVSEEDLDDISFNENGEVFEVKVSNNEYENLSNFIDISDFFGVAKTILDAKNLTFVVDTSLITDSNTINLFGEIKFDIETLSLSANLTVQYGGLLIDFGVYLANINENSQIYITIGGETLKFDLNKIDLNTILQEFGLQAEDDLQNVFDSILNNFQVNLEEIDVKETVIDILQNLSISEDVVDGATQYVVEYKTYSLTFNFDSATNNFFNIQINPFSFDNIQIAKLDIINLIVNDSNFKIEEPKEYSDLSSIFDIVDDAKIKENVYAISGDLAVRYSTTSFYGDILAMLIKTNEQEGETVKEIYTPYVRLYTSSMNLNTYIYLIGNVVYIDLQGLRIKADLTQTTINEIMEFVQSEFMADQETSEEIPKETLEEFEFILPALENISANWLYLEENLAGLQINIDDELYYTASAFFDSIVLQAFGIQDTDGTILPTEIVIGANINDANTTVYDNYDEYLLENETLVTASKNFAVYLTNVEIGGNANYQEDLVFDENYENVISLTGNENNEGENSYHLEDYLDYSVLLDSFKLVKDYIFGYQYQINVDAQLGYNKINGDVNVDVTDIPENGDTASVESEESKDDNFTLFGGKNLEVQGDFDMLLTGSTTKVANTLTTSDILILNSNKYTISEIAVNSDSVVVSYIDGEQIRSITYALNEEVEIMSSTQNLISLLYDSDETDSTGQINENYGGLYLSYSHGEYITSGDVFRGRIKNLNMSDMISFILGFANIELGQETMESWHLEKSQTDFSYIQQLLGITGNDVSDDISKVDSILGDVSAMLEMLKNIDLRKTLNEETGLYTTELEVLLKLGESVGNVSITLYEELVDGKVVTKLRELKVSDFVLNNEEINLTLTFEDFDSANFDYFESNPAENHFDLSNLPEFMDTAINTLNTKNFTFKGNVGVDMASIVTLNLGLDLYISIEDIKNPYIYAQISIDTNSIASIVFNGDFDTRMITYEYKDGVLTFHRYSITSETHRTWTDWIGKSWTKVVEDQVDKNNYNSDEILPNLTKIVLDSMGMKEVIDMGLFQINIPDMIMSIIESLDINPSLERSILGFSTNENHDKMTLSLDMEDITGIDGAENTNIALGTKKYQREYKDENGNTNIRNFAFIDSITELTFTMPIITSLTTLSVDFDLYSQDLSWEEILMSYSTASYQLKSSYEDNSGSYVGGKFLYTNDYYRQEYIKTQQVVA